MESDPGFLVQKQGNYRCINPLPFILFPNLSESFSYHIMTCTLHFVSEAYPNILCINPHVKVQ